MTQYLFSVHHSYSEPTPDPEEMSAMFGDVDAFNRELQSSGAWVFGGGLEAPDTATVVRIGDGKAVLSDGPYAESKEHLGGFWVIDAADLDAALRLAEEASRACRAPVEVRPFQAEPESAEG
jgi:hypothetical protein